MHKKFFRQFTIYVVDDSELLRELVTRYLNTLDLELQAKKKWMLNIKEFSRGEDCIEAVKKEKPAIVLTEYILSPEDETKLNGIDLLKKLKKISPHSKAIVVSAQSDLWVSTTFYLWGASDYISKGPGLREKIEKSVVKVLQQFDAENEKLK